VQIIIDNAPNYVVVDKLLMERHLTVFWTPCAAHCIDLMLEDEDVGKISFTKEVIDQYRSITKFIYSHAFVLSLMRKFTIDRQFYILQSPIASFLFFLCSIVILR